ncbi:cyclic nucleotide-binding domain-containing protein 2-like [Elysia marginata]|uniref:Cyclic nucleotide-binding domain-containing protein 2-like n=1 Tax=Elysia marginata TaxID=1093978 RepID=A0AAV4JVQ0_9GAST|nr:cyclic nucleotide-binding domain-containing protein 2-like [Elysia marginata]
MGFCLVVADARFSRQNSFELGSTSPTSPTQVKSVAKKKFISLARAGSTVRLLFRGNNRVDGGVDELEALDKFKVMVRKIQVNQRWSGMKEEDGQQRNLSLGQIVTDLGMGEAGLAGDETSARAAQTRRTVSFGDVTMGFIHKNVDRKKVLRFHKWGQEYNRKKRLITKFQRAVKLVIFCRTLCNEHAVKSQEPNEFSPFIKIDCQEGYEPDDLLFDPSKFKANKESRITDEFIRIMSKMVWERTPQEIYYAQIALRNIECFQDFPARMQQKIAERGMYEKYVLHIT